MRSVSELKQKQIFAMKAGDKDTVAATRAVLANISTIMTSKGNKLSEDKALIEAIKRQHKEYTEYAETSPEKKAVADILESWMPTPVREEEMLLTIGMTKADYRDCLSHFLGLKDYFSNRTVDLKVLKSNVDFAWGS